MSEAGSVTRLIDRIRAGDPGDAGAAAAAVWARYFPQLLRVAAARLCPRVRQRVDGEDVLQDAGGSFFVRLQRGEYDLAGRDDLWALLVQIVRNKAMKAAAREQRQKRDVRRELPPAADDADVPDWLGRQPAADPTPADAAALAEELDLRLCGLDPDLRAVAEDKLHGFTNREIADRRGVVERTIERKVERIRHRWEPAADEPDAAD